MNEDPRFNKIVSLIASGLLNPNDAWTLFELLDNNMYYTLTEEEIDSIVKELKETFDPPKVEIDCSGTIGPRKGYQVPEVKSDCIFHEWILYTGLNETFEHCKKCGEKKK